MSDYRLVRSVRGLPSTMEAFDISGYQNGLAPELWSRHAAGGMARDGSPSGYEYAVVGAGGVLLLRPWWHHQAGALQWRKLGKALAVARVLALMSHTAMQVLERTRDVAVAVADLDALYAACSTGPTNVIDAISQVRLFRRSALAAAPWLRVLARVEAPAAATDMEQQLIAAIVETPADAGAATVYADWLEEVGRLDEAVALRPDVVA